MAGGNGSCVGGWIPSSVSEAQSMGGFDVNDVTKQFGRSSSTIRLYTWYKCNGLVPCAIGSADDGFSGDFSPVTNKVYPYTAGNPIGFGNLINHRIARVIRKPHQLFPTTLEADVQHNGLYLDLTGWTTSQTVNVKFERRVNNSGHFISMALYGPQNASGGSTPFTGGYSIRGQSDESQNYGGTRWAYFDENTSSQTFYLRGGLYYMFRSRDHSANSSGIYCGGEDQGGGAGTAQGGTRFITVHDNGVCCGDNNTGGNADFAAEVYVTGWS